MGYLLIWVWGEHVESQLAYVEALVNARCEKMLLEQTTFGPSMASLIVSNHGECGCTN